MNRREFIKGLVWSAGGSALFASQAAEAISHQRYLALLGGAGKPIYQGQVMTGCRWPLFNATQQYFNSQSPHFAVDSGSRLKIVLCNAYASETLGAGTMTYTAAIWSAATATTLGSMLGQFLFSGVASGTCASGALLESDWLPINYTKGTQYFIRVWGNGPLGMPFYQCPVGNSDTAHGAVYENSATSLADKTTSGVVISSSNNANSFCPIAVVGDTKLPSILTIGDSLTCQGAASNGDTFDGTSPRVGFPDRVLGAYGYAGINVGVPGETIATFITKHSIRAALQAYVSGVWNNYGINDVAGAPTAAAIFANLQTSQGYFTGKTYIEGMIGYEDTSTDSFATLVNQTPKAGFTVSGKVDQLNALIAAMTGARISDQRSAAFSVGSNIWLVDGTANKYTADGTHYNQFSAKAIASSGAVPAALFAR